MTIPDEFTPDAVAPAANEAIPYDALHRSGEPYRSLLRNNAWMRPPAPKDALEWGKGWYYDTIVARKHPQWRSVALPRETKDAATLRRDFVEWGHCLIEDGTSREQCERLHERVADQAATRTSRSACSERCPRREHATARASALVQQRAVSDRLR